MERLRASILSSVIALMCLAGFHSPAQTRGSAEQDMLVRSIENTSQIANLQRFVAKMEGSELPERIARIEEKLSWLEWAVKALLAGVAVLLLDRLKAVVWPRARGGPEE